MKHTKGLSLLLAGLIFIATTAHALAEDRGHAYVSNQDGGITVIDLNTLEATGNIDIQAKSPRGIAVTPDGKFILTANQAQKAAHHQNQVKRLKKMMTMTKYLRSSL